MLLAAALVYTSFSASSEAREPSDLAGVSGGNYELTGNVSPGSIDRDGDRAATSRSPTATTRRRRSRSSTRGTIPDPFRDGREVIVSGTVRDGTFVAENDSLITKCPSKFADEAAEDPEHVVIQ